MQQNSLCVSIFLNNHVVELFDFEEHNLLILHYNVWSGLLVPILTIIR